MKTRNCLIALSIFCSTLLAWNATAEIIPVHDPTGVQRGWKDTKTNLIWWLAGTRDSSYSLALSACTSYTGGGWYLSWRFATEAEALTFCQNGGNAILNTDSGYWVEGTAYLACGNYGKTTQCARLFRPYPSDAVWAEMAVAKHQGLCVH
jgi:hypothetical protein